MNWLKQWDATDPGLPKGKGKGGKVGKNSFSSSGQSSSQSSSSLKGGGKNKRFKTDPGNRIEVIERLCRSTANLAQKTARQVALLFSLAVATILCPAMPALKSAGAVYSTDPNEPLDLQFQRWGHLTKGLSEDPKTLEQHKTVLSAHVKQIQDPEQLRGKVLVCKVKPSYRDATLFVVQLRVSPEYTALATAVTETLVKAGGNLSFQPASRSGEERQVEWDLSVLDSM